ncbi:hypothetical protein OG21DRAFT_1515809 [Imleria badia]|nr:hypothetical protein OG21DRAFT_1515809 [Imleria badia]
MKVSKFDVGHGSGPVVVTDLPPLLKALARVVPFAVVPGQSSLSLRQKIQLSLA